MCPGPAKPSCEGSRGGYVTKYFSRARVRNTGWYVAGVCDRVCKAGSTLWWGNTNVTWGGFSGHSHLQPTAPRKRRTCLYALGSVGQKPPPRPATRTRPTDCPLPGRTCVPSRPANPVASQVKPGPSRIRGWKVCPGGRGPIARCRDAGEGEECRGGKGECRGQACARGPLLSPWHRCPPCTRRALHNPGRRIFGESKWPQQGGPLQWGRGPIQRAGPAARAQSCPVVHDAQLAVRFHVALVVDDSTAVAARADHFQGLEVLHQPSPKPQHARPAPTRLLPCLSPSHRNNACIDTLRPRQRGSQSRKARCASVGLCAGGSWGCTRASKPEGEAVRSPPRARRPPRMQSRSSGCGRTRSRSRRPRAGIFGRHAIRSRSLCWQAPHGWRLPVSRLEILSPGRRCANSRGEKRSRFTSCQLCSNINLCFLGPSVLRPRWGEPGLQSLEQPGGHCLRPGPAARASCSGPASSSAPRRCASLVSRAARPTPHATSDDCGKRVRMTFGSWSPKPLAISSGHGGAKCVTGSQLHGPERRHVFEKSPCFRQAEQRPFNPYPPTAIPLRGACGPLVHRSHLALPRRE
jgi:hypothetical protein